MLFWNTLEGGWPLKLHWIKILIGLLYLHDFCKTLLDAKGTATEDPHPRNIEQTKARSRQQTRDEALEQGILRRQEKGCWCLAAGEGIGCPKPPMLSCLVWRCWDSWYHGNGDRHDDVFIMKDFSKGEGLDWQHIRNEFYTAMPESFGEVTGFVWKTTAPCVQPECSRCLCTCWGGDPMKSSFS